MSTTESGTQPKSGRAMDPKTQALFDNAEELLKRAGIPSLQKELEALKKDYSNPRFTVAVVGEFSRGKSTLVNKLLDTEILPTDVLPSTALITRIIAREKEMLIYVNEKGEKTARPLRPESWKGLVAKDKATPDGVVFLGINNPWLARSGIELIDTPGTNDIASQRSLIADKSLMHADAAIITVSAMFPFSLTEKMFIRERVLFHNVPKTILCVSMLDQFRTEDDRIRVLERIRTNAEEIGLSDVEIFVPQDDLLSNPEEIRVSCGITALKRRLAVWTKESDLPALKRVQISSHIWEILEKAEKVVSDQREIVRDAESSKMDKVIAEKQEKLEASIEKWDELTTKMREKSQTPVIDIEEMFDEKKAILTEQLCHELSKTTNPKNWASKDYPYSLKMKIIPISQSAENIATRALHQDANWLQGSIKSMFGVNSAFESGSKIDASMEDMMTESLNVNSQLTDVEKSRTISRILVGAAQVTGATLITMLTGGAAMPMLGSVGGSTLVSILSNKKIDKQLIQQRELLAPYVEEDVNRLMNGGKEKTKKQVSDAYEKIINDSRRSCDEWRVAMLESFEKLKNGTADTNTGNLDKLKLELQTAIDDLKSASL